MTQRDTSQTALRVFSKVPEVTVYFWVIKVLCTTVGETAADFLATHLNFGLTLTTALMSTLLLLTLVAQFRVKRYVPGVYWLAVVLLSIVGTQITDNLVDNLGVPLQVTTGIFGVALAATFLVWYAKDKTLSIHSIVTRRRETFYWLAILFTFALGTAAGDLVAERMKVGYLLSAALFAGIITLVTLAHLRFKLDAVLAFWIAYIVTRPLGASMGDYLSQTRADGGLNWGTVITSVIFLSAILLTVVYLTVTKKDALEVTGAAA